MHLKSAQEWAAEREDILESLRQFARIMKRRPFDNRYGLRGVSAFALYWFIRRRAPTIVFEVGVWKGFSTWLIEQAAPEATIHCFDPLMMLEPFVSRWKVGKTYRSRRAHYSAQDFSCASIRELLVPEGRALAFFDDHQNKLPRLLQCKAAGIREIVFDDNFSEPYTHRTLEHERANDPSLLEREIARYEIFPALWPFDFRFGDLHLNEQGMNFPFDRELRDVYRDRHWHSYVTYVQLK